MQEIIVLICSGSLSGANNYLIIDEFICVFIVGVGNVRVLAKSLKYIMTMLMKFSE